MKRRAFLLLSGAAAGVAALDPFGCDMPRVSATVEEPTPVLPGEESFVSTTCLMCPGACGLRVRRVDGVPVGIKGNPDHPINAGGVCREGFASFQLLYHPDRQLQPLRRTGGERGRGFEPVAREEALVRIVRAMKDLRHKGAPEKVAFVLGRSGGSMADIVSRFMDAWGSPNLFLDEPQDGRALVFEAMHGVAGSPAYDFNSASLVLSFGTDLLEAWESPLQFQRSCSAFRDPSRGTPGSMITVDVRYSETVARSQEWVTLKPGSFGALALGIAYVILRERMYDESFAAEHLHGLYDFRDSGGRVRQGFQNLVLKEYSPETVSQLTGVPVERILSLGKSFGENPAALAVFGESVVAQPGGLYAAMAVHSLNLLKGNINRPGGIYLQPEVPLAPLAPSTSRKNGAWAPKVLEDLVGPAAAADLPEVLFLYYSNPLFSSPLKGALEELLKRIPLIVSFSPFLDETCRHADLLLPDALFLERWEDRRFPSCSPVPGWGIVQPCVAPAGDCLHAGDFLLRLAKRVGDPLSAALPWESFEELLRYRARGLFEARAGTLAVEPFVQGLVEEMERRGWWMGGGDSFDEFWEKLLETGAWTDANYRVRTLRDYSANPDGRFDLYSRALERRLSSAGAALADLDCLPHHVEVRDPTDSTLFPLVLHPFRPGKLGGGTSGILPWVLQETGALQGTAWNSWAEVNSEDAKAHDIKNGDSIWVENKAGKLRARAIVFPGAVRGVIGIPCGFGHKAMGRWADGRGVNPLDLLPGGRDPLTHLPQRFGVKVKIYRA